MLREQEGLPEGFLDCPPQALVGLLGGPTLIHIPGRRTPPLFVSVLAHGNETTGVEAVQQVLARYQGRALPRALSLFVGNVEAAAENVRRLDGQPDFNRIWPGTPAPQSREARWVAEVTDRLRECGCFASLDIHNNTGRNPHYACVNRLQRDYLALAALFSRTIVYFTRPLGVQSLAFAPFCPAVTVECGQPGSPGAVAHAAEFIDATLNLASIPTHVVTRDIGVFHTVAVARVADDCSVGFSDARLVLAADIDRLNFRELPAGTELGRVHGHSRPVTVEAEDGRDVTERYLAVRGDRLVTRRRLMPSMLTRDLRVIRQDCLGYFMEQVDLATVVLS
jgi:hypothetical protein